MVAILWRLASVEPWRATYRFTFAQEGSIDAPLPATSDSSRSSAAMVDRLAVHLGGRLIVEQPDSSGVLRRYRMLVDSVSVTQGGVALGEVETDLRGALREGAYVRVERGARASVLMPPGTSPAVNNVWRAMLAMAQVDAGVAAEGAGRPVDWKVRESDPNGWYDATYTPVEPPLGGAHHTYRKTMAAPPMRETSTASNTIQVGQVLRSGQLTLGADSVCRCLVTLEGESGTAVRVGNAMIGEVHSRIVLERVLLEGLGTRSADSLFAQAAAWLGSGVVTSFFAPPAADSSRRASARRLLIGVNPAALLAELRAPHADSAAQDSLQARLEALIVLRPEMADSVVGSVMDLATDNPALRIGVRALGAAATAPAQVALARLMVQHVDDAQIAMATGAALMNADAPGDSAIRLLGVLARWPGVAGARGTARLVLGAWARGLREDAPSTADSLVLILATGFRQARDHLERRSWIDALGNAGGPDLPSILQAALSDSSPVLRSAAVYSLRHATGGAAERTIVAMLDDREASVRGRALSALELQPVTATSIAALVQRFDPEPEAALRMQMLRLLWSKRTQSPSIRNFVTRVAASDASTDVRRLATRLLAQP